MNEINHHLTDALLMAYSAGTLPEAFDLVVATHISLCDECRARMHEFDAVGGNLMEDAGTVAMGADSLAATLAMIADRKSEPAPRPAPRRDRVFPAPLQDYVGGDLDAVKWRRVGGGVSDAILRTRGEGTVRLLRIPGGVAVPDHGHRGMELTLVLQGAFRDDTDRFGAGDIEVADDSLVHQPVAMPGPDCICLAATDAPLRFNALIPRLAQPFLRI
jgi:putative transcriptional regulator